MTNHPNRITIAHLQAIVDRINRLTNSPMQPYTKDAEGRHFAQVGNYHLDMAYGGYQLMRMSNSAGGASDVLSCGHVSKRELQLLMFAYIRGLEDAKQF